MNLKKEYPLLLMVLLPFLYLIFIWNDLPETVPTHWNGLGEIDGYSNKTALIWIPFIFPLLIYILLTIVPKIDPKNKINAMGKKYDQLKFILILFMTALALFILYSSNSQSATNPNILFVLLGMLFAILGNYMKTLKPNYFIGIKTPWTLENETVWKKTHILGGKVWLIGGLAIVFFSMVLSNSINLIFFISTTLLLAIIPIIYSYLEFKKLKN